MDFSLLLIFPFCLIFIHLILIVFKKKYIIHFICKKNVKNIEDLIDEIIHEIENIKNDICKSYGNRQT